MESHRHTSAPSALTISICSHMRVLHYHYWYVHNGSCLAPNRHRIAPAESVAASGRLGAGPPRVVPANSMPRITPSDSEPSSVRTRRALLGERWGLRLPTFAQQPSRPFPFSRKSLSSDESGYLQHAEDLNKDDPDQVDGQMLKDVFYIDRMPVSAQTMIVFCKTQTRHTETSCDYVVSFRRGTDVDTMEHVAKEIELAGGEIEITTPCPP